MKNLQFKSFKNGKEFTITNIDFSNNVASGVNSGDWEEFDIDELLQVTNLIDINLKTIYDKDIVKQGNYTMIVQIEDNLQISFTTIEALSLRNYRKTYLHEMNIDHGFEVVGNLNDLDYAEYLSLLS